MGPLLQDLRYGIRMLARSPGFTAVAVLTLALGIGANTAVFTLINAVMLKSLPVRDPQQLYRLGDTNNCCEMIGLQGSWTLFSFPLYVHLRDHTPEFSEIAAFQTGPMDLSVRRSKASAPAEALRGELVSGNYFRTFGIGAFIGRVLTPADDTAGAPPVAVMGYRTWQQNFGLDPSVVGASFSLGGIPYTIAGVAPPGFYGDTLRSDPPDFWLPLSTEPLLRRQNSLLNRPYIYWLYLIGRLKAGAQPARVQAELTVELEQSLDRWLIPARISAPGREEVARQHITLTPAPSGVDRMQRDYAAGLRLLILVSAFVLLIACANIANLLLARGAARRVETAVRLALGAPRGTLIRQALTESVLLAVVGGVAGLFVAMSGARLILLIAFRGARTIPISPNPSLPVLGFAFLLSLVTGIVFGAAPAWISSRSDQADALHGAGRSTSERASLPRKSLVVFQVALSLVLLAAAGLLTQSLRKLQDQQFGFETQGRVIVRVDPALAGYTAERLPSLYQRLEQQLVHIPGVLSASFSSYSPMRGQNWNQDIFIEGRTTANPAGYDQNSSLVRVSAHYFETVGTRLLRGRVIDDEDTPTSRPVAVINQTFARKFFLDKDPIGQHFGINGPGHSGDYEIVGIVEDAKYQNARKPAYPTAFFPLLQTPPGAPGHDQSIYIHDIELHVAGKPENLESRVRRTLAGIDPDLTVLGVVSFDEQVSRNFNQERLIARLTEFFGLLALILACVGLYGVTAYSVARRTKEMGIRMALGASRSSIVGLVLRGALVQVMAGLAIGVPAALAGGPLLRSLLYSVQSTDAVILVSAALTLSTCAVVAALVPARRATKVDPMVALRYE